MFPPKCVLHVDVRGHFPHVIAEQLGVPSSRHGVPGPPKTI